ncbi:hypothetical protein F7725_006262 [Dissostichus mawsoni]|uniref:Uncharacterized protein n=1 Tax=Dissostichus mawsoni TaxID=36200 RepID=A0A7J5YWM9_DISMA|nr:hypothetical protein F7725_006262 [Dissostichus mawsoni]
MSFVRILRALLQHVGKEGDKAGATPQVDKKDTPLQRAGTDSKGLLNRNLFLVAYIWGFSGHLHPRTETLRYYCSNCVSSSAETGRQRTGS